MRFKLHNTPATGLASGKTVKRAKTRQECCKPVAAGLFSTAGISSRRAYGRALSCLARAQENRPRGHDVSPCCATARDRASELSAPLAPSGGGDDGRAAPPGLQERCCAAKLLRMHALSAAIGRALDRAAGDQ